MNKWERFFESAYRKGAIARYYKSRLEEILTPPNGSVQQPQIPVQAYFEGTIVSAMAAVDQVAQAINSALQLNLNPNNLVNGAFMKLASKMPEIQEWYENPLGVDLRRIRTRIVHYSYLKHPDSGCQKWKVEVASSRYEGSRELVEYASAAVGYVMDLCKLIPTIDPLLCEIIADDVNQI